LRAIRGGESQDAVAGVDEKVLAAVVFDQAIAMVAAVVLDDQLRGPVIEIRSTK